jgi:hypothetical protein
MATCVAQQTSSNLSTMNYPRKLLRAATYDSLMPVTTRRKRLSSAHEECRNSMTKFSNDNTHTNKRKRTGK